MGCDLDVLSGMVLLSQHFFEALWIEADHDLVPYNNGRCPTALIGAHQFANRAGIAAYVAQFEFDASLREEGLRPIARRSTGLAIKQDALGGHTFSLSE